MRICITSGFDVPGEKDNGRRMIDFCAERGLYASNTYLEHKNLQKCTRTARGEDGMEVMNTIDLLLVKKAKLRYEQDVRAVRGMGIGVNLGCGVHGRRGER